MKSASINKYKLFLFLSDHAQVFYSLHLYTLLIINKELSKTLTAVEPNLSPFTINTSFYSELNSFFFALLYFSRAKVVSGVKIIDMKYKLISTCGIFCCFSCMNFEINMN